ncbi:pilus assembly protein [Nocardioides terrisoli]|uniref:pilus assembly protein n=1 Tax=Nocardioides terrisoli TaxID=3388267 RepID=UPI00287B7EC5|nr:pilus assembly protein [Nocardioides marmorisolisilvae]
MFSKGESGAVTAETAVVLPILAVFTVGMAWLVSLGVAQVRVQDAAREAARVIARGDTTSTGVSYARRVAPTGSKVVVENGTGTVVVTVRAPVRGPRGVFAFLPEFDVHAQSVAARETSGGPS